MTEKLVIGNHDEACDQPSCKSLGGWTGCELLSCRSAAGHTPCLASSASLIVPLWLPPSCLQVREDQREEDGDAHRGAVQGLPH